LILEGETWEDYFCWPCICG